MSKKMIVITNIEYIETNDDELRVARMNMPMCVSHDSRMMAVQDAMVDMDVIRGRRFRRISENPNDCIDILIGMDEKAGELFGLQYEAFERLENDRDFFRSSFDTSNKKVNKLRKFKLDVLEAGFFMRLKYLFTGQIK